MVKAENSKPFIQKEFIPTGKKNRPGTLMSPTSITIHNTDNANNGANAKAHSKFVRETGFYMLKGKKHWVSWHFTVDDKHIIQHLPVSETAYHAGSMANGSSIAIEICMNADNDQDVANRNAASLVATILSEFGWNTDNLKMHKDWTGKNCPSQLLTQAKWDAFKALVNEEVGLNVLANNIDAKEIHSAKSNRLAPENVSNVEIDHLALNNAISVGKEDMASHSHQERKLEDGFRDVLSVLSDAKLADWPKFFPGGINHLELKIEASGFHITIKGPENSDKAINILDGDGEYNDTVPDDGFDLNALRILPPISSYLSDTQYVYGTHSADRRYGMAKAIQAINKVAAAYFNEFGIRLGIGDLSKEGGGTISGHASHKKGVDVDVRVPRSDSQEKASNYKDASYSRQRTQKLVNLFRQNGIITVTHIFFNDAQVTGVSSWPNHDNHLHVRFDINEA